MFKKSISKAFTLVEIMIVIIVVWLLFWILTKVYILSSKLYVYQKHVKNVEKDILFFNQNLQNLVDTTEIDYDKYSSLGDNSWFTGTLYLKDKDKTYKLFLSGDLIYLNNIPLTSKWVTSVKSLVFKIIPFKNPYDVLWYGQDAMQPFIKVFMHIQNNYYTTWSWENAVNYEFEESFNFKYFKN